MPSIPFIDFFDMLKTWKSLIYDLKFRSSLGEESILAIKKDNLKLLHTLLFLKLNFRKCYE